jgi:hypothetical protein
MHDSRRYRMNAAECLLAAQAVDTAWAKTCQSESRSLLLSVAPLGHRV